MSDYYAGGFITTTKPRSSSSTFRSLSKPPTARLNAFLLRPNSERMSSGSDLSPTRGESGRAEDREDVLGVGRALLVGALTEREHELAVGQDVRDAKLHGIAARQAVRLARRDEANVRTLEDREQADVRIVAPRFALDPLVAVHAARHGAEHVGDEHRAGEAAGLVEIEADRLALADVELLGLLGVRDQQLLAEAPIDERADRRDGGDLEERDLAERELRRNRVVAIGRSSESR